MEDEILRGAVVGEVRGQKRSPCEHWAAPTQAPPTGGSHETETPPSPADIVGTVFETKPRLCLVRINEINEVGI